MNIKQALQSVPNAPDSDVASIVTALSKPSVGFNCEKMTTSGPFLQLNQATLSEMGLNVLQVAIVLAAQGMHGFLHS
jgi:hypothetical protein